MVKFLDAINVIDLETTCWQGTPPINPDTREPYVSEIIEIGLCTIDLGSLEILQSESVIIKPLFSPVSEFSEKLNGISQAAVDKGNPFTDAMSMLATGYRLRRSTWASWGDFDRVQFHRDCDLNGIKYPFGRTHLNIKNLYALSMARNQECGLKEAAENELGGLEGRHHSGEDDAKMQPRSS